MSDPVSLAKTIKSASEVANTPLFTTIIDKVIGFRLSKWAAEGEVRKKLIHDEYEKAKEGGIMGMQYIEYMRNTENLIDTAVKSSKYIDPNKTNDIKMDNDFFWNTIEHAKTVSSDEVQELVAKIIAGEYNKPGTYSMSTLQTLKMLGKNELELFERMCSLCVNDNEIPKTVFSLPETLRPIMDSLGIDFSSLQSLQTLGLFLPNDMSHNIDNPEKKNYTLKYFNRNIRFESTHETNFEIKILGYFGLSITGKQIIKHLNPKFINDYFMWLKGEYKISNYKVIEN